MSTLEEKGFDFLRKAVDAVAITTFIKETERLAAQYPDHAHGIRALLRRSPFIAAWADKLTRSFAPNHQPVRGILFDKTPTANWKVAWHQDLTIALKNRVEKEGYGPWSIKEGIPHVQPPVSVLESMFTARLHLDHTPAENGALKAIPRSHLDGRLSAQQIEKSRKEIKEVVCEAYAGDILLIKPLVLHASSASEFSGHRRVVHIEFAPADILDDGLQWHVS